MPQHRDAKVLGCRVEVADLDEERRRVGSALLAGDIEDLAVDAQLD
jgi:hypothetical protein